MIVEALVKTMEMCACCGLKLKQLGERTRERVLNAIISIRNSNDEEEQQQEASLLLQNLELFKKNGYDVDTFMKLAMRFS